MRGDWYAGERGPFDLVVSNPPYIAAAEIAALAPDVRDWEPRHALTAGPTGLEAYVAIAGGLAAVLAPGGRALLEIGPTQADAVAGLLAAAGLPAPGSIATSTGATGSSPSAADRSRRAGFPLAVLAEMLICYP